MGSYAQSIQKDQRIVADSAQYVTSPESVMALPYSVAVGGDRNRADVNIAMPNSLAFKNARELSFGDIVFNEFNPQAQELMQFMAGNFAETMQQGLSTSSSNVTTAVSTLSEQLEKTRLGTASAFVDLAKLAGIAIAVYFTIKVLK